MYSTLQNGVSSATHGKLLSCCSQLSISGNTSSKHLFMKAALVFSILVLISSELSLFSLEEHNFESSEFLKTLNTLVNSAYNNISV